MNNFPENEKNELEIQEEQSTIFANPTEHKTTATEIKVKKKWPIVIASLLAVGVLIGATIAIIKLIPEKKPNTPDKTDKMEISVLEIDSSTLKNVEVKNKNGTFLLYSEQEKSSEGESGFAINWYLEGYRKDQIDIVATEDIINAATKVAAFREITTKTAAQCGLESPQATVKLTAHDGAELSIIIGSLSPDNSGYYLKVSNNDKIYLVESYGADVFFFEALDLATTEAVPPLAITEGMSSYISEAGDLSSFDTITLSGKDFPQPLIIVPNTDEKFSNFFAYLTVSPQKRFADNVGALFDMFKAGIASLGAYSFDASSASIAAVGLNDPDYTVTIKAGTGSLTYKFKLQSDGNYAVIYDGAPLIKKVAASSLAFAGLKYVDFYSEMICLNAIDDLKGFIVKTPEADYNFTITKVDDDYDITCNGEKLKTQSFKNMYELCVELTCDNFTVDDISFSPEYSLIFVFNDEKGGENRIDFVKHGATRYQYYSDGTPLGKVNSSALNKIIKEVKALVK